MIRLNKLCSSLLAIFVGVAASILGGIAASIFVSHFALTAGTKLGWDGPIVDWMGYGARSLGGNLGVPIIAIPALAVAMVGGAVIGLFASTHWWRLSLLYSGTMFAWFLLGTIHRAAMAPRMPISVWTILIVLEVMLVPAALAGAWLTSRQHRIRASRKASGLCLQCGYSLAGNVSGICPECGEAVGRA